MFAAVDLGSNSFRLHIGEPEGDAIRIVRSARDPVRLAAGLDAASCLTPQAVEAGRACLARFREILDECRPGEVRVVATNTVRVARNAAAFLPYWEQAIGHPIEVISGEEEGRLIYMGVARALAQPDQQRLVVDIGGGSTELVAGRGSQIQLVESFGVGTQRQGATFFPGGRIDRRSFDAAVLSARARFEDAAAPFRELAGGAVYGSSGTIRAIAEVITRNTLGDGTLALASLQVLRDRLVECGNVAKFDLPGIKPERVIVMAGGLAVLIAVVEELGIGRLEAINAGLRLGVLSDLQLRANRHDRRDQAVLECIARFGADRQRAQRAAAAAAHLYAQLMPQPGPYARYLQWACLLHEVGLSISHTGAHKHAAYIVEHADLAGFTTREQRIASLLVQGQKGNLRKVRELLSDPDATRALLALRLGVTAMHANADGDIDGLALRFKSRIEVHAPRAWLQRHPTLASWLEREAEWWDEAGVGFVLRPV